MTRVRVLLFGPEARAVGSAAVEVELATSTPTCGDLRRALADDPRFGPRLSATLASCRFAVNHAFAREDTPIGPGDEVGLIGLVSGG